MLEGFYVYRWRLALLIAIMIPAIIGTAYYAGLRENTTWISAAVDGITAYAVGAVASMVILALTGIITWGMPWREIAGKVAIQSTVAGFGAAVARGELGGGGQGNKVAKEKRGGYAFELLSVAVGAFYLSSTVAATMEMILIPFKMTMWHALALVLFELVLGHAFVHTMKFEGAPQVPEDVPEWSLFVRYTLPSYVIALGVAAYMLWTFGRFEIYSPHWMVMYTVALGLPASIGGAAGRIIL